MTSPCHVIIFTDIVCFSTEIINLLCSVSAPWQSVFYVFCDIISCNLCTEFVDIAIKVTTFVCTRFNS